MLLGALVFIFLVPATLLLALVAFVSYPTLPTPTPWQAAFDVGFAATLLGAAAAWRLVVAHVRHRVAHPMWLGAAALGAALGLLGVAVGAAHWLDPDQATELVGLALLAPGAGIAPPLAALLWRRRNVSGVRA
ncbi:MAG TPA: hypothetical protein VM489_01990 [Burkholderiales bacterium]|nr:hypothetical protein [Burkholderiales bacterium]